MAGVKRQIQQEGSLPASWVTRYQFRAAGLARTELGLVCL